jgi:uncharacterized protein YbjT (DUF2867 family)
VFGARGTIGSNLVPRLLATGHRVRAAARDRSVREARSWAGIARPPEAGERAAYYRDHHPVAADARLTGRRSPPG